MAYTREQLEGRHTRELLKLRRFGYLDVLANPDSSEEAIERAKDDEAEQAVLKEVLATREHIPNKSEAKAVRRAKAKAQRNR